jgi:hypothetical protein
MIPEAHLSFIASCCCKRITGTFAASRGGDKRYLMSQHKHHTSIIALGIAMSASYPTLRVPVFQPSHAFSRLPLFPS